MSETAKLVERIDELLDLQAKIPVSTYSACGLAETVLNDCRAALESLTAEVERLTADAAFWKREEKAQREFSKAVTAERDRLRSELDEAREASEALDKIADYAGSLCGAATHDFKSANPADVGLNGMPVVGWREAYFEGCKDMAEGVFVLLPEKRHQAAKAIALAAFDRALAESALTPHEREEKPAR